MTDGNLHPSAQRVADAATKLGLTINIVTFEHSTRTAVEAAQAVGCDVGQIVKSLVFTVKDEPVIALVSGANQLDTRKLAALFGVGRKQVERATAETVRSATGFAIGGVPPFGHATSTSIYIDKDLTQYDVIWAAAGTPNAVFAITPTALVRAVSGHVSDLKADPAAKAAN
ncbi:MAG: YbaK/EbsC family protein [Anaerolineales bacterium]|uniref:YbaK/EbsC family protein n=1 Tax=Promineifilum sp. TaxID=2664178 RepID=UPI001D4E1396|nr:YbaK/EbsC family protein [Anaerolineales bacterium]MCO5178558.1 YbaK/EbsC family protein [Promineifilum sp.]